MKILPWKMFPYEKYIIMTKQKWKYYDFALVINCTHKLTCVCTYTYAFNCTCLREQYDSIETTLPKGQNTKIIGLMKDELGRKIMTTFARLRAKTHSYLTDDGSENKQKTKRHKKVCHKKENLTLKITKTV